MNNTDPTRIQMLLQLALFTKEGNATLYLQTENTITLELKSLSPVSDYFYFEDHFDTQRKVISLGFVIREQDRKDSFCDERRLGRETPFDVNSAVGLFFLVLCRKYALTCSYKSMAAFTCFRLHSRPHIYYHFTSKIVLG
jgi:hypothetical protein